MFIDEISNNALKLCRELNLIGYQTQPVMPPPRAGMPPPSSQAGSSFNPATSYSQEHHLYSHEQHFENGAHDVYNASYDYKANFALVTRLEAFDISYIHKLIL